ncbi:lipopolysaccharide transport periplasmic protein LptA [Methyloglobulus morosus KoM1]|uniref:Lipopolysaccharide export system protein LptA n=1 Tax=Methyloglobulus morosus KoM1 TaxID=1116472 RepID=V5C1X1_9GAMM|nr:lipopolysaccharide transport periplasmic protein LptA [Methyloglobulus morosus]ESS72482.1 lipopolysaccharide transport periplasmic protein LptA [Methyloglobulus morosus KoM1]
MKRNKIIACCWALLTSCCCTTLWALESDADQPITIDSNTATYDDATSTSIYTGNVISIQGTIRVNSDKLVVYFLDGEADKLVFTGNKAKFKQTPSVGAEDVTGEALTGEYYPKKNLLVLIKEATVWQGNGTYSSDYIEYNSKSSVVKAGDNSTDAKRVHVLLKPKQKTPNDTGLKTDSKKNDDTSGKTSDQNLQ